MFKLSETFFKVDLHVHTPASSCYTGDKSENGYWEILRSAIKNNVKLIAITDHNTLAGYEKLVELRDKTYQEYSFIQKYTIIKLIILKSILTDVSRQCIIEILGISTIFITGDTQ